MILYLFSREKVTFGKGKVEERRELCKGKEKGGKEGVLTPIVPGRGEICQWTNSKATPGGRLRREEKGKKKENKHSHESKGGHCSFRREDIGGNRNPIR